MLLNGIKFTEFISSSNVSHITINTITNNNDDNNLFTMRYLQGVRIH